MKKLSLAAFLVTTALSAPALPAMAGQTEDILARLDAVEKENAAIRRENAALLENKKLHEQNARLKTSLAREPRPLAPAVSAPAAPVAAPVVATSEEKGTFSSVRSAGSKIASVFNGDKATKKDDPFGAYAADLPVAYKAAPPRPGRLTFWGEGGAIWSGGDPVSRDANLIDPTTLIGLLNGTGTPEHFNLDPKIGWEAAAGFDYRFANSPWHVSGQFRYGESGKVTGNAATSGQIPANVVALIGGGFITAIGGSEAVSLDYKETHWLADAAVGYDIATSGRSNLQLKGGMRIAEFTTTQNSTDLENVFVNFTPPFPQFAIHASSNIEDRANFLGAGPLVGLQGTVRFMGNWSFDYAGDMAILFGSQHSQIVDTGTISVAPPILNQFLPGGSVTTTTADRFTYVLSGDVQAGIGYWFTPNLKLAASYRLDSMINVQNTRSAVSGTLLPSRYWHGPRLTLLGQFDAE